MALLILIMRLRSGGVISPVHYQLSLSLSSGGNGTESLTNPRNSKGRHILIPLILFLVKLYTQRSNASDLARKTSSNTTLVQEVQRPRPRCKDDVPRTNLLPITQLHSRTSRTLPREANSFPNAIHNPLLHSHLQHSFQAPRSLRPP